jgi:hypothetical protein
MSPRVTSAGFGVSHSVDRGAHIEHVFAEQRRTRRISPSVVGDAALLMVIKNGGSSSKRTVRAGSTSTKQRANSSSDGR